MYIRKPKSLLELASRHVPKGKQRMPGDAFGIWRNRDPLGIWAPLPWKGEPKKPEPTLRQQSRERRRELLEKRGIGSKVSISWPEVNFDGWDRGR